ncbi:DHA1 family arabinose polymer transporter-like MFS transporter [Roseivirga pacifica]|uniref:MFS transporter, DHA1 family, arabinose polymer transporter n=1 Tax=Roseivirga pacifica TaxID=1267423 RepID=A0A1I0MFP2_9BACT|nr:MFS transporter [Roseivirga pacifica]RKQ50359.1 DHA1 family arabinose polymer transporter-like MFS transporter [Roseivirga pacifica]SEV87112.1 MFS transporter, DHA1 family, arabinose polymer transporter [Roseivirga pacifica]
MKKALIALAIGGFGIGMTEFVIMGILPDVAEALNISIPKAGHFISAYALGVVVGAPILTGIGGKWPAHKVLLVLMLWFTIFNTISAFANSYTTLLIARFLSGFPHGAFFGIGAVVAGKLADKGKAAQAIAVMFSGLTLANLIGVPLGTYFGHHFHWNIAFMIVGVIGILAMVGIYYWMPELPQSSKQGMRKDFGALKRAEIWLVILLTTIGTGGFFAWYSYIAPLITEVAGYPENAVGYAMVLAGGGMVIGNIVGAKVADKYSPINAVIIFLSLMVVALVVNTLVAHNQIAVMVMTFLIGGLAFCIASPIQMTMINSAKGSEMLGSSLNQSAFNMGNASGAYLAGLPIAMGYGFTSADLVGAAMAGGGIIIALVIVRVRASKRKASVAVS